MATTLMSLTISFGEPAAGFLTWGRQSKKTKEKTNKKKKIEAGYMKIGDSYRLVLNSFSGSLDQPEAESSVKKICRLDQLVNACKVFVKSYMVFASALFILFFFFFL
jgi:hypothetical protein